jgi:tRNA(Ile)-lysidine synthase
MPASCRRSSVAERGTHKPYVAGSNPAVGTNPPLVKYDAPMPYRPQSANRLTERVLAAVRTIVPRATASHLLVACSGGADSVCLAHAVAAAAQQHCWSVTIAHVRHDVRPGDDADVEAVRTLAARLDLPCAHETLAWPDGTLPSKITEADLRAGRYAALARMARAAGARAIVTGHTMDDQAETILLHLLRGTGLTGLTGMQPCAALLTGDEDQSERVVDRLTIVRPLLGIRRDETKAYCAAHGLPVIYDPSNDDQAWTRNWLRHTVLPELRTRNPAITETLARAAGLLAADALYMDEETARALARNSLRDESTVSIIDQRAFANEPPALRRRIVRTLLARYGDHAAGADDTLRVEAALVSAHTSRIMHLDQMACAVIDGQMIVGTPADVRAWIIRRSAARYPLFHGNQAVGIDVMFALGNVADAGTSYRCVVASLPPPTSAQQSDAEQAAYLSLPPDARLAVRNRQPGDRFHPVGRRHALLLQDYLTARGIPAPVRDWLPLLVVNGTIAWVIGHEVSAEYAASRENATHIALLWRGET